MLKKVFIDSLLRKQPLYMRSQSFSVAPEPETTEYGKRLQSFRTTESNPQNHNENHLGQFYTVLHNEKDIVFSFGGLPKKFQIQTKTFDETCIMIRKPAIDIINCLKRIDYSKPAVKFVLYGKKGSGKSLSLAHIIHYGMKSKYLLVHVPWVGNWMRRFKDSSNSETQEGYIDINIDSAAWLAHFKNQNQELIQNLTTSQDHEWSKREMTPKGATLAALVDHGINRIKYASNCIVVLADEIKKLSRAGLCKTLVAVDGYNAFFYPRTRIKTEKKEIVHPFKVVPTQAFLSLTNFDWNNAAVIVTVDELAIAEEDHKSHLPRYLLGKEGFEHLDPFIPVLVPNYSMKELTSCLNYYRERRWISPHPGQDEELAFISASNPYALMERCAAL